MHGMLMIGVVTFMGFNLLLLFLGSKCHGQKPY